MIINYIKVIIWPLFIFYLAGFISWILFLSFNLDMQSNFGRLVMTTSSGFLIITGLLLLPKILNWKFLANVNIGFKNTNVKSFVYALLMAMLLLAFWFIYDTFVQAIGLTFDTTRNAASFSASTIAELLANIYIASLITPLIEESMFRGFMFDALKGLAKPLLSAIVVSVIFAIVHFDLIYAPFLFVFSMALCLLRERSKSILPGMLVHVIFNSSILVMSYFSIW